MSAAGAGILQDLFLKRTFLSSMEAGQGKKKGGSETHSVPIPLVPSMGGKGGGLKRIGKSGGFIHCTSKKYLEGSITDQLGDRRRIVTRKLECISYWRKAI